MAERFAVVVADPPWAFNDKLKMSAVKRGAEANYRTLTLEDICALPVASWAASDCVLALWVPSSMLADGLRVCAAWGFVQKQIYTWVKTSSTGLAFGMGRHFRGCTEHALISTRGKPRPLNKSQRGADLAPAMPHSRKPDTLQDRLELMYPGPWLELFARRARPGWTCVGDESPDICADIRDWRPMLSEAAVHATKSFVEAI